jgi:hypothetical protein
MTDPRLQSREGNPAAIWVEPSPEQWALVRRFPRWFAPTPEQNRGLVNWFGRLFVVPSTNLTNFSLRYQSYLNDIFHTSVFARVMHFILMPLITGLFFVALGRWHFAGAIAVAAWWLAWGLRERLPLWGVLAAGWAFAIDRGSVAFLTTGHSPWPWILVLGALQAASHSTEPGLPPRVNGTPRWVPLVDFLLGPKDASVRARRVLTVLETSVYGTFAEIIASPRLAPIQVLEVLWALGYTPGLREEWKASSRRAIETQNPALDYIGEGGATSLRWVGQPE